MMAPASVSRVPAAQPVPGIGRSSRDFHGAAQRGQSGSKTAMWKLAGCELRTDVRTLPESAILVDSTNIVTSVSARRSAPECLPGIGGGIS